MARGKRSFGSVFRRPRGDGTFFDGYYVRWTDAWGRRHQAFGGGNKDLAEDFLAKKRLDRARSRVLDEVPPQEATFQEFLPRYLSTHGKDLRPSSLRSIRTRLTWYADALGAKPLSRVTKRDVQQLLDRLQSEKSFAPASVLIHLVRSLRALLQPREAGGYGLTIPEVAKALGMAPKGHGVRTWTGTWQPRAKRFVGGRNLPTGARREALAKFVHRMYLRWSAEAEKGVAAPPAAK